MSTIDYIRVKELFMQACDLDQSQRTRFLDEACGDDPLLRAEVDRLFLTDESAEQLESLLDLTVTLSQHQLAGASDAPIPEQIGSFRIIGKIGQGGMGVVYEAIQRRPKRKVALKVMRSALASPQAVQRFEREVELLGRLRHPQMAQIYDAGIHDSHRPDGTTQPLPYFALELVNGVPITEYVREHQLGRDDILRLTIRICEAVTYAHRKGVIHLDLKPANILIDHAGHPKILDFGIARALDHSHSAPDESQRPNRPTLQGTIPYLSPEQLNADDDHIDQRADVHALGMVSYELLAHRLPWALDDLTLFQAIDTLRRQPPTSLRSGRSDLPEDLNFIIAKAIARDHDDRYESPEALAQDIRRFLDHRPLPDRPATVFHRTALFIARHRALSLVIAIGVMLCLVLSLALWRSHQRIDELERRLEGAQAIHSPAVQAYRSPG